MGSTGPVLDVFKQEPPENEWLYTLDNLVMGSHTSSSTVGSVNNMGLMAARNLLRDLELFVFHK